MIDSETLNKSALNIKLPTNLLGNNSKIFDGSEKCWEPIILARKFYFLSGYYLRITLYVSINSGTILFKQVLKKSLVLTYPGMWHHHRTWLLSHLQHNHSLLVQAQDWYMICFCSSFQNHKWQSIQHILTIHSTYRELYKKVGRME